MLILARAEQLQHLRFALCPKRMDEQVGGCLSGDEISFLTCMIYVPQSCGPLLKHMGVNTWA